MRNWLAVSAAAGALGVTAYGIAGRSAQVFGSSVYKGPGKRRSIALTFDDGPSQGSLRLAELLDKHSLPATFFQCGINVKRHPEIARTLVQLGHEIGNHTYSHPRLCPSFQSRPMLKSPDFIFREFARAQQIISEETSVQPRLLRAPYGLRWHGLKSAQQRLGLLGVMWTVIGHDWEWKAEQVASLVLRKASPGGIVCLHDGRDIQIQPNISEMLNAVRRIIPVLKDQGYSFETVTQILRPDSAIHHHNEVRKL